MTEDVKQDAQAPAAGVSKWRSKITISLSAFVMSLAMTAISAYSGLRGSDIVVVPPKQVLVFRDGEGANSILAVAARFDIINASADYGDVMLEASARIGQGGPSFAFSAPVKATFTSRSREAAEGCAIDSRCIPLAGLLVVEQPDTMIDFSGGASRTVMLAFPAAGWNCPSAKAQCADFESFEKALTSIGKAPLQLEFSLKFNSDGDRKISCGADKPDVGYLAQAGWLSLACKQREVKGRRWSF